MKIVHAWLRELVDVPTDVETVASQIALREKDPAWSLSGPVLESIGDPIGIRAERLRRR